MAFIDRGNGLNFQGAHILSINQFEKQDVTRVFDVADQMQPYALRKKVTRVLEGAILGNMFFEASTRTRVSFGSAFNLLGGEVRETAGFESSALVKGSLSKIPHACCLVLVMLSVCVTPMRVR